MLSDLGYAAFAADIFGADLQDNLDINTRINLTTSYRTNQALFVQRIERAIAQVQTYDFVDPDNVAVIGYCFGGTGIVNLAFSGFSDAKVVVSLHGGLTDLPSVTTDIAPYTLMYVKFFVIVLFIAMSPLTLIIFPPAHSFVPSLGFCRNTPACREAMTTPMATKPSWKRP